MNGSWWTSTAWVFKVVWDRTVALLGGPTATPQQASNAQLVSFLYQCWSRLVKLKGECGEEVFDLLKPVADVRPPYSTQVPTDGSTETDDARAI